MIGRTVGNYVIQDRIGVGGMGVVYLAEHPRIGRRVAIKVLLPEYSKNSNVVARFFNEARAANEIRHEHIVDIIDFGEMADDGSSYIIMELLEGKSLEDMLIETPRLPLARAVHIARGIGRALGAAHVRGIVHRDLKPDNVFLVQRESDPDFVKVLDFGIAKLTQEKTPAEMKTQTGALIGTPTYMAPEQCRGLPVDGRTDEYALGVILYRMLTGKLPFDAENLGELLLQHMTKDPAPLRQLDPTIPLSVEAAVLKSLAKDPDQRYARIEELLAALVDVATGPYPVLSTTAPMSASGNVTSPTVATPRPSVAPTLAASKKAIDTLGAAAGQKQNVTLPPTKRGVTVAIAAIAGVAVLGGGIFFMTRSPARDKPAPDMVSGRPGVAATQPPAPAPVVAAPQPVVPPPAAPAPAPAPVKEEPPAPTPAPIVAAPAKHKKEKAASALPKPPPAESAPAKSDAPRAETKTAEKPAAKDAAKPDAKKPVYKGTKGNLITDFPSE